MRVLIVDDNLDSLEMLSMSFRLSGHEVWTLQQPELAVSKALEVQPDLIFLDLEMPDIDGYTLAELMRRERELERAFLVALTGRGLDEDRARTHAAGFDAHVLKPVDLELLKKFLDKGPHPAPRPRLGSIW